MKATKFMDAKKAFIIRRAEDGTPVVAVCKKAVISSATFFNWKKNYSVLVPSEMKRLRELEQKNARLKKFTADLALANQTSGSADHLSATGAAHTVLATQLSDFVANKVLQDEVFDPSTLCV